MLLVVALTLALTGWSLVGNLVVGERLYTSRNVVLTGLLLAVAAVAGLDRSPLGLAGEDLAAGASWGFAAAGVTVVVLGVAVLLAPHVRGIERALDDRRGDLPRRELLRHSLVRIPLGTAVFEEVAFRGVLLAALLAVTGDLWAVAISSAVFGVWHVAPTIVALQVNGIDPRSPVGVRAVVFGVVVTTVAGVLFALLRLWSGSLLAPIVLHTATNVGALQAAAIRRRARSRSRGSRA